MSFEASNLIDAVGLEVKIFAQLLELGSDRRQNLPERVSIDFVFFFDAKNFFGETNSHRNFRILLIWHGF